MSDSPGGPDWFQATDGKWYPPATQQPHFAAKKKGGCLKWGGIGFGGFIVLIIIIAIAANAGSSSKSTTSSTTTPNVLSQQAPTASPAANDVSVSKCATDPTLGFATASLTVVNHSSKTSDYTITVAFDAPNGSQFDTGLADVQTLAPGQTGTTTADSSQQNPPSGFTCKVTQVNRTASSD